VRIFQWQAAQTPEKSSGEENSEQTGEKNARNPALVSRENAPKKLFFHF